MASPKVVVFFKPPAAEDVKIDIWIKDRFYPQTACIPALVSPNENNILLVGSWVIVVLAGGKRDGGHG